MRRYFEAEKRVALEPYLTLNRGEPMDAGADTIEVVNIGRSAASWVEVRASASIFNRERREFEGGVAIDSRSMALVFERLSPFEARRVEVPHLEENIRRCEMLKDSDRACQVFVFATVVGVHATTGAEVSATEVFLSEGNRLTASAFAGGVYEQNDGGLTLAAGWHDAVPKMRSWFKTISHEYEDDVMHPATPFRGLGFDEAAKRLIPTRSVRVELDAGSIDAG